MSASSDPIFDIARLEHQSHGDGTLKTEVLALFVVEVERLLRQIEDASDPQVRADRLAALSGAARNIGALRLTGAVQGVQTQITADAPNLESLRQAVQATIAYIGRYGG